MFKSLKRLFSKTIEAPPQENNQQSSILPTETQSIIPENAIVKDQQFFARKNNLVQEFVGSPPPISSSNFSSWEADLWKFKEEYNGFMALGQTEEEIALKKERIDKGDTHDLYPIEVFKQRFYRKPRFIDSEEDELLYDDVDLLKDNPGYAKPNIPESKTIILQGLPKTESVDTGADHTDKK